jgi:anti-sigma factor RsiW
MVCSEVRERLSEYLDGVLPIEIKTRVDDHLCACTGCRKELESLKTVVKELSTLHQVDPPDDFLEQIHGRMTARPWHQRVLRFLFLPPRFKIPIQVAGALTVALLVFSILTLQQDEKDRLLRPSIADKQEMKTGQHPGPAFPSSASAPEIRSMAKGVAPTQAPTSPARVSSKPETERIREAQTATPSENLLADDATGIGAVAKQQRAMALVLRTPMNRFSAAQDKDSHKAEPEGGRYKTKKDVPVDPLVHELKALAARHQGRMLTAVYEEGSGRLDLVEIEIPSSQYGAFSEGLRALGELQPPLPVAEVDQGSVKLRIKVIGSDN